MSLKSTDPLYERILHLFRASRRCPAQKKTSITTLDHIIIIYYYGLRSQHSRFCSLRIITEQYGIIYGSRIKKCKQTVSNYYQFGTLRYLWWHCRLNLFSARWQFNIDKYEGTVGKNTEYPISALSERTTETQNFD